MPRPANPKDALLAWVYKHLADRGRWSRIEDEFLFACQQVMPEISGMTASLPATPLEAVRRAREEQDRLVGEIWETRRVG